MSDDRRTELRITLTREPCGRAFAVSQPNHEWLHQGELVDVMQQRGRLDEAAIDRSTNRNRSMGQPGCRLGDGP